jgi:DNA-binding NarL/FixJ family response regulator
VDDYEPWRRFVSTTLQERREFHLVAEATDGLQAIQVAQELQPDLILLDIGLPALNGIEAARQIREISPESRILFVSDNQSREIAEEALRTGGGGYVVKSAAVSELLPAVEAVLQGDQFVSARLTGPAFTGTEDEHTAHHHRRDNIVELIPRQNNAPRHHEVGFYSDDQSFPGEVTRFIGAALQAGNAAVVVATESHQNSLLRRLQAQGLDIDAAIEQGRYILVNPADTLSMYMVDRMPDPVRYVDAFSSLILTAEKAADAEHPRVAVYGEGVHLLWAQGNAEAAIQVEKFCNQLTRLYDVDIFCGYSLGSVPGGMDGHVFQRIQAEHSAVYFP